MECKFCNFTTCVNCVEKYMMTSHVINCMNCFKDFDKEFLYLYMNHEFINNEVMIIMVDKIFKQQMRLMKIEEPLISLFKKYDNAPTYEDSLTILIEINDMRAQLLKNSIKRIRCVGCDDGIISVNDGKCGRCDGITCIKCENIITVDHECDVDNINALIELKKTCKQCPVCCIRIYKSDGCDQMFCIKCKTPFDWESEKVIRDRFYDNPHYMRYLDNGGKNIFKPVIYDKCSDADRHARYLLKNEDFEKSTSKCIKRYLYDYYNAMEIITLNETICELYEDIEYIDERKNYLLNNINEKIFKQYIVKNIIDNENAIITINMNRIVMYVMEDIFNAILKGKITDADGKRIIRKCVNSVLLPSAIKICKERDWDDIMGIPLSYNVYN